MEQLKQFCKEGWDKVRHNDLIRPGNRKKKIMVLIGLSVFLLACGLTAWFYGKPLLEFVLDTGRFRAWMNEHGALGPLAFVAIRTVQTVVKIIPAEPLEIGAGYAFGSWWGMALCMLGTAIGSLIIIGLTKLFGMRMVEVFVPREKLQSFRFLQNTKKLNLLLFIIFLIPGTPKDLITYFVGVTPVNPFAFLLLTGIARIPSILSSTLCGNALGERNFWFAAIVYLLTGALTVGGIFLYRRISRQEGGEPDHPLKKTT